jgi:hypothetical protein
MLNLERARKEIAAKEMAAIERDTALTWGGRAAASYECALVVEDIHGRLKCFWEAENYRQEALEHAAMTEDMRFVEDLLAEVEEYRAKAREALEAERAGQRRPVRPKVEATSPSPQGNPA